MPCRAPPSNARSRTCGSFHAAQATAPLRVETAAGRGVRALQRSDPRGGPVRARGVRPAAFHRHHAGGSRRHRSMPGARDVHAAGAQRRGGRRGIGGRAQVGHRPGIQSRRRASHRRHGLRHGHHPEVRQGVRARQCIRHGRENAGGAGCRRCGGGPAGRRDRGDGDRGRHRPRRIRRGGPLGAGRAQSRRAGAAGHDLGAAGAGSGAAGAASVRVALARGNTGEVHSAHARVDRATRSRPRSRSPMPTLPSICCSRSASRAVGSGRCSAAGAVFLGHWSPESLGDYCSGPNHTLPTYGYAKAYSGLSLEDFQKRITVQELTPAGLAGLGADGTDPGESRGVGRARGGGDHPARRARRGGTRRRVDLDATLAG